MVQNALRANQLPDQEVIHEQLSAMPQLDGIVGQSRGRQAAHGRTEQMTRKRADPHGTLPLRKSMP
jgi:hypothetical protein